WGFSCMPRCNRRARRRPRAHAGVTATGSPPPATPPPDGKASTPPGGRYAPLPGHSRPAYARRVRRSMMLGENPSATRSVRVLTIDDQAIFWSLARDVIEATPGFESVGDAANGEAGIEAVGK